MKNIFEYGVTVVHLMVNLKLLPPTIRLPATEKEIKSLSAIILVYMFHMSSTILSTVLYP